MSEILMIAFCYRNIHLTSALVFHRQCRQMTYFAIVLRSFPSIVQSAVLASPFPFADDVDCSPSVSLQFSVRPAEVYGPLHCILV